MDLSTDISSIKLLNVGIRVRDNEEKCFKAFPIGNIFLIFKKIINIK